MTKGGRPPTEYPRCNGIYIRFSDTEIVALQRALESSNPVADRRPSLAEWLRNLAVAHASEVLQVQVMRSGLHHLQKDMPNWKRWKLTKSVRLAAARRRRRWCSGKTKR